MYEQVIKRRSYHKISAEMQDLRSQRWEVGKDQILGNKGGGSKLLDNLLYWYESLEMKVSPPISQLTLPV